MRSTIGSDFFIFILHLFILLFLYRGISKVAKANKVRCIAQLAAKAAAAMPPATPQTPRDIDAMEIEVVAASSGA